MAVGAAVFLVASSLHPAEGGAVMDVTMAVRHNGSMHHMMCVLCDGQVWVYTTCGACGHTVTYRLSAVPIAMYPVRAD